MLFRHLAISSLGTSGEVFIYPNVDPVLLHGKSRDCLFFFPKIKMEGNLRDVYLLLKEANVKFYYLWIYKGCSTGEKQQQF